LIREATHWPQPERDAAIDWVFDHPHRFLTEDIAWAAEHFGMSPEACRDKFRNAERLFVVWIQSAPIYLFAYGEDRIISTASEYRLDRLKLEMTKTCIRYGRSEPGQAALRNTVGFVEATDLENGLVRARWLEAIGYERDGQITHSGQTFDRFTFQGNAHVHLPDARYSGAAAFARTGEAG
jgi:hypothetical protein